MKYLISCLLALSILNTKAQKKISFTVFAGSNFTTSGKTEHSFNTIEHNQIGNWVGDTVTLGKNYYNYTLSSSYSGKWGFSFGVKASYNITDYFSISGGIGISKFGVKRNNQLSYKRTKFEQITVIYPPPPPNRVYLFIPGLETTGYEGTARYYYHVYEENIHMVSLQVPIEMLFRLSRNSRFDLKLGVTPAILLNYELKPNKVDASVLEISGEGESRPKRLNSTESKFNLIASAGIGYPIYKAISGHIYYTHFFNTITEGAVIPAITPHVYGASLVYQLPNFNIK